MRQLFAKCDPCCGGSGGIKTKAISANMVDCAFRGFMDAPRKRWLVKTYRFERTSTSFSGVTGATRNYHRLLIQTIRINWRNGTYEFSVEENTEEGTDSSGFPPFQQIKAPAPISETEYGYSLTRHQDGAFGSYVEESESVAITLSEEIFLAKADGAPSIEQELFDMLDAHGTELEDLPDNTFVRMVHANDNHVLFIDPVAAWPATDFPSNSLVGHSGLLPDDIQSDFINVFNGGVFGMYRIAGLFTVGRTYWDEPSGCVLDYGEQITENYETPDATTGVIIRTTPERKHLYREPSPLFEFPDVDNLERLRMHAYTIFRGSPC